MYTKAFTVEEILSDSRQYIVPLYQRNFQWHESHISSFWLDIEAKATEILYNESKFHHYMGALILSPVREGPQTAVTPKMQVVDGQQRLTTFQIFLVSIREVARAHDCENILNQVGDYTFNKLKTNDTDDAWFKLTPTLRDRELFFDLMNEEYGTIRTRYTDYYWGNSVPLNTRKRILRAYERFHRLITAFVQQDSLEEQFVGYERNTDQIDRGDDDEYQSPHTRLHAVLTGLLERMKLVVIELGEDDDAQVIFETLNSRGEPLLAMDLVRNNIFHRAEKKEQKDVETLYHERWIPFDDDWWKDAAPFTRPTRPRIDHFLSHVLAAESGQNISMRELYAEYRDFAVPNGIPKFSSIEEELKIFAKYKPHYETLEALVDSDKNLYWLGRKFAAWQVTTAYPIVFQICESGIGSDEKLVLFRLIYSYIVRRALSGFTTKNLNRIFQSIAHSFLRNGVSVATLRAFFSEKSGESTCFPDDSQFRHGIVSNPAYSLAPGSRIQDILWELEMASVPKHAEKFTRPAELWVEHVLPRTWTEEWPFECSDSAPPSLIESKIEHRNRLLNSLGNLTLLTPSLNIDAGNSKFLEKRERYKRSKLWLNDCFQRVDSWYERNIEERSRDLADKAVKIWPALNSAERTGE